VRRAVTGLGAWLAQRASAVYMLLFIVFVLIHFLVDTPPSYWACRLDDEYQREHRHDCFFAALLRMHG